MLQILTSMCNEETALTNITNKLGQIRLALPSPPRINSFPVLVITASPFLPWCGRTFLPCFLLHVSFIHSILASLKTGCILLFVVVFCFVARSLADFCAGVSSAVHWTRTQARTLPTANECNEHGCSNAVRSGLIGCRSGLLA